jgi:surface antigen
MNPLKLILIPSLALSLAACEASNEELGTLIGAVGGAVVGDALGGHGTEKVILVAAGTMAGALFGASIGRKLDAADRQYMETATQQSLETSKSGYQSEWINPDSGNQGSVTPEPAYKNQVDQHCREFTQTVTIGGKTEEAYGTACRQPDGSWRIVNDDDGS